ncbi:MAG: recombinase [Limnoraphis robusta]
MSNNDSIGGAGSYKGYEGILANAKKVKDKCEELKGRLPKGISFKLQGNKYLYLQWSNPVTGGRTTKNINVPFDESGVYQAIDKAWKIKDALSKFTAASEFNEWYEREIEGKNEIVNDLKTYREIIQELEDEYFNGLNAQTKRPRSRKISNDALTWKQGNLCFFEKLPNWDKQPTWEDFKTVLFTYKKGTNSFEKCYYAMRRIAEKCPNNKQLLERFAEIDPGQTIFKDKQSVSWKNFLEWREIMLAKKTGKGRGALARKNWLWLTSMCILYALRPTEIAAAINLDKPYIKDGVTIPAINDPSNKTLLLVLGDFTYFGTSIKTGGRVCKPVTTNPEIIELLQIREISLHEYKPKPNSLPENDCTGFNKSHSQYMRRHKAPATEIYAFRHLGNQLGEMYGVPQEIRARSMGHSVEQNDTTYKKRKNLQTTVDILLNHSKQPLSLELAKEELERLGFDLENKLIKDVLKIIYQLE